MVTKQPSARQLSVKEHRGGKLSAPFALPAITNRHLCTIINYRSEGQLLVLVEVIVLCHRQIRKSRLQATKGSQFGVEKRDLRPTDNISPAGNNKVAIEMLMEEREVWEGANIRKGLRERGGSKWRSCNVDK